VAIAFDARHGSRHFASLAAATLAAKGVRVFLFEDFAPTPLLAWTVTHLVRYIKAQTLVRM
jgi:phosphomannomutase